MKNTIDSDSLPLTLKALSKSFLADKDFSILTNFLERGTYINTDLFNCFNDLCEGYNVLKSNDIDQFCSFTSDKSITIIVDHRKTVINYLKNILALLSIKVEKINETREFIRQRINIQEKFDDFEQVFSKKLLLSLDSAFSKLVEIFNRVSYLVSNNELNVLSNDSGSSLTIQMMNAFENIMKIINALTTFSFSDCKSIHFKMQALDFFEISPLSKSLINSLISDLSKNNIHNSNFLLSLMKQYLTRAIQEYCVYDCVHEIGENRKKISLVIRDLSEAGQAIDSIPKNYFVAISRISSIRSLVASDQYDLAEIAFREALFLDDQNNVTDLVLEDKNFVLWNQLKLISLTQDQSLASQKLKRVIRNACALFSSNSRPPQVKVVN